MCRKKLSVLLLCILMLAALIVGCAPSSAVEAPPVATLTQQEGQVEDAPVSALAIAVADMAGREVELDKPAEKIVALTASDCEIIYAIGAGDKLIGRGEYCDYPAETESVEIVKSGEETNTEQIIALMPDLVIMGKMAQSEEQIDALTKAGIPVAITDAQDINGVYTAIELIGELTGCKDNAETVVSDMRAAFADIQALSNEEGKTVYFEVSPLEWGLWTAGSGTFMDEIAGMLKLENAFADVEGWSEISEEQVIQRDPDYIITIAMYFGEGETPEEEIMGRDGWQDIAAIKNAKVFNADSNAISRPGPRLADAAKELYGFISAE